MKRISVIIPVFNNAGTVARAIDSAIEQKYRGGIQVIVVNDGSIDPTAEILKGYGELITVISQAHRGLAAARNVGAWKADGELLAFLDADDVWLPWKLARMIAAMEQDRAAVLAYSNVTSIDDKSAVLQQDFIGMEFRHAPSMAELLTQWWPILPSTVVMRRESFQHCGGFSEKYRQAYEVVDLWLRARETGPFIYVPEELVLYRVTPVTERMRKYAADFSVFEKWLKHRYGSSAKKLLHARRQAYVSGPGFRGVTALRQRDKRAARRAFVEALHYNHWHWRTMLRLTRTMLPGRIVIMLSGKTSVPNFKSLMHRPSALRRRICEG